MIPVLFATQLLDPGDGRSSVTPIEILFCRFGYLTDASRLSSDWESARLKIELSPVQIGEAASYSAF